MSLAELLDQVPVDPNRDRREYLGGSLIAHDCPRWIWLSWRWCLSPANEPRLLRIFEDGHLHELSTLKRLERFCEVEVRPGGDQVGGSLKDSGGHVQYHVDNILSGIPRHPGRFLFECKSASNRSYRALDRAGSYLAWNEQYYGQVQFYLGALAEQGQELDGAVVLVYNKDTSEYYSEYIDFDYSVFDGLKGRAFSILESEVPPEREYSRSYYKAKNFMSADDYAVYFGEVTPIKSNCRNCSFSRLKQSSENGLWGCAFHQKKLSYKEQLEGCADHQWIPELVPGELVGRTRDLATYKSTRGEINNSKHEGIWHYTSDAISFLTRTNYGTEKMWDDFETNKLQEIAREFGGSIEVHPLRKKEKDDDGTNIPGD